MKHFTKKLLALLLALTLLGSGIALGYSALALSEPAPSAAETVLSTGSAQGFVDNLRDAINSILRILLLPFQAKGSTSMTFDLDAAGKIIGNKFSDINTWSLHGRWSDGQLDPAQFAERYPFARTLQFMTATGGNATRDLFIDPNDRTTLTDYKFEPLLAACRHVLSLGMKPMIKTGAVPLKLSTNPIISGSFGVNVLPPDDFDQYYTYIKAAAQALVDEFGVEEIKTWSFGVLTEFENVEWFYVPGLLGVPSPWASKQAYFQLYDTTVAALQDVLGPENLTVGAHAMTGLLGIGFWSVADFVKHCGNGTNYATGKTGTQLDFLAASYYDTKPGSPSVQTLGQHFSLLKKWAKDAGLEGLRYGVDEGRVMNGPDDKPLLARIVGMSWQGSVDARHFKSMIENDIDWFATWDGALDLWNDGAEPVSTHIAFLGYQMENDRYIKSKTAGRPVCLTDQIDGIGGYDSDTNTARFMIYNYNRSPEAGSAEPVQLTINNVGRINSSKVTVREYLIDDDHANFWPLWWEDQQKRGLTGDDFGIWSRYGNQPTLVKPEDAQFFQANKTRYQEAAELKYTEYEVPVKNGAIQLTPTLQRHGVGFYEIFS